LDLKDHIARIEKQKYERVWREIDEYRGPSSSELLTPLFLKVFESKIKKSQRVIDFGCGPGRSVYPLLKAGLEVELIDFASNCLDIPVLLMSLAAHSNVRFHEFCLWDLSPSLAPAEWGICFDVLEHIPPDQIDRVLAQIASRVTCGILIIIDLQKDKLGDKIGEPLHLTIQPSSWWREHLERLFNIHHIFLDCKERFVVALFVK